jgi:hypothetical protein
MGKVNIKEISYKGFGKCMEISNGEVDLVVTVETGPRIIRYGFVGERNQFCDDAPLTLDVNGENWRLMGGHRLWTSPEEYPRTYMPDNKPVEYRKTDRGIIVRQKADPWVQVEKEMEISISERGTRVTVGHKLVNRSAWPVEMAAWALSVMDEGGISIIPVPQHESHFSDGAKGSRVIALWAYSRMDDTRVRWGNKYITLRQDGNVEGNIKFGISNEDGWAAYINKGNMFINKFGYIEGAVYPDKGVSYETFTNDFMLEIESLSPLTMLKPGESLLHEENWYLFKGVDVPENEDEIDEIAGKYIKVL